MVRKGEYLIIIKKEDDPSTTTDYYPILWRLLPRYSIPDGFRQVFDIRGIPVYTKDGFLKPKFRALRRYIKYEGNGCAHMVEKRNEKKVR